MEGKRFWLLIVSSAIAVTIFIGPTHAQEEEVVTNATIIKMLRAKLGEGIIISKIMNSKTNFDLSTDGLIKLKTAGGSDNIITAIQATQQQSQSQPQVESQQKNIPQQVQQQAEQSSKAPTIPTSGDVFIMQRGKAVGMDYVLGFTKMMSTSSFTLKTEFVVMADGEHAQLQIKDKNPIFYIRSRPELLSIVKFDTDTYNKKPVRYVLFTQSIGDTRSTTKMGKDFDSQKETNGLYKITFKAPVEKGEYGIMVSSGQTKIFDFAVVE
jgi:hypothetical protein